MQLHVLQNVIKTGLVIIAIIVYQMLTSIEYHYDRNEGETLLA